MDVWHLLQRFAWIGNLPQPNRQAAINQHTIKLLVGLIAILLPFIEWGLTGGWITSISESFWYADAHESVFADWPRAILTGFLFAITALLLSFNGDAPPQGCFARVASLSATCIALFPCQCRCGHEIVHYVHYISAGIMYAVLAWFCLHFFARAHSKTKNHSQERGRRNAKVRRAIYATCLLGMIASALVFVFQDHIDQLWRPVLIGEAGGLISFGFSWLTASRKVPWGTTKGIDRLALW